MKLKNKDVILFLNELIQRIDAQYTKQIDNPKTSLKQVDQLESQSLQMTSEIQNVINYISLYN